MDASNVAQLGVIVDLVYKCIIGCLDCWKDVPDWEQAGSHTALHCAKSETECGFCACCRSLL